MLCSIFSALCGLTLVMASNLTAREPLRCIMYYTGQHPVTPPIEHLQHVTHVAVAFMSPGIFNDPTRSSWPLWTTVDEVRAKFPLQTKVLIGIGGWGDTLGFSVAALTEETRRTFAQNVAAMVDATGADGIDVDWEYPGGNGEDYKQVPNKDKHWEIHAYPLLLTHLRTALGPSKILSAAVPGLPRDMIAFTHETLPHIMRSLDFLNVMTYDLMNRRDTTTTHHTGLALSLAAINAYVAAGVAPQSINLGFAFYVKWFHTEHEECAGGKEVGCPTLLMEDPETGADLGKAGAFSWHDAVPTELAGSFNRALDGGEYDEEGGGHYFWDEKEDVWWSWDTAEAIRKKFETVVEKKRLGGVFAWGLGEDAPVWEHLIDGVNKGMEWWFAGGKGHVKDEL